MLANVLDTPIPELAMGDDVDTSKDFIDAWALKDPVSIEEEEK